MMEASELKRDDLDPRNYTELTLDQLRRLQGDDKFKREPLSQSLKAYWDRVNMQKEIGVKTVKEVGEQILKLVAIYESETRNKWNMERVRPQMVQITKHLTRLVNGDESRGLLLHGASGMGKTTIMKHFYLPAYRAIRGGNFLACIPSDQMLFKQVELIGSTFNHVCIDDLGAEVNHIRPVTPNWIPDKQAIVQEVYYILDKRRNTGKITHATSNMDFEQLVQLYGNRVIWRFQEMFEFVKF